MARKISLALYQLSINRKGNRDDRIVLSDFMNLQEHKKGNRKE